MIADGGWELSQEVENDLMRGVRREGERTMRGGSVRQYEVREQGCLRAMQEGRGGGGGGETRPLRTTREQS